MLRTDQPDHRRSDEAELLAALSRGEPLALAEAYHRSIPAAHACARRLVAGSLEVEALLRAVFGLLWSTPPTKPPLEAWIRMHCFRLGGDHLRERGAPPAVPSLGAILPDLPAAETSYQDPAERIVVELSERDRLALLRAHDAGLPSVEQPDPDAGPALERALLRLADVPADTAPPCARAGMLGDVALGLLALGPDGDVGGASASDPACKERLRLLRQGRRRLEGLPPTPDMGQRILVTVLTTGARAPHLPLPPAAAGPPPAARQPPAETDQPAAATGPPLPGAARPDQLSLPTPVGDVGREPQPAGPTLPGKAARRDPAAAGVSGRSRTPQQVAASTAAPGSSTASRPPDAADHASPPAFGEERSGHLLPPIDEPRGRTLAARAVRFLGYVLLLALGAVLGVYAGSWFVAR